MRPEILFPLFKPLSSLPGCGPRTQKLFDKLGLKTVRDIILTPPSRYTDRTLRPHVQGLPEDTDISVRAIVVDHTPAKKRGLPYHVKVKILDTMIDLVFFRPATDWLRQVLPVGAVRIISGKLSTYNYAHRIVHPDHILTEDAFADLPKFEAIYPLTAGLGHKTYRKVLTSALKDVPDLPEWLDTHLLHQRGWLSWRESIRKLHAPLGEDDLLPTAKERERLAYDEVLAYQMALLEVRAKVRKMPKPPLHPTGHLQKQLLTQLPYALTGAQERVVAEIIDDLRKPVRMMRLLQGDVGAGKTLVALLCALAVTESGGQTALMVPTEVLARQHGKSIAALCATLQKPDGTPVRCVVLTGRDKGSTRQALQDAIAAGDVDIVVGTHALFQQSVTFHDLKFIVLDEQHRFGVDQRLSLIEKGDAADVLTMTATPIPRTLCLAHYGDMDFSILDEKPAGRQPIETRLLPMQLRIPDVVHRLRSAFTDGHQAYWICPLVEESEKIDLTAAQTRFDFLQQALQDDTALSVGLVHGKQPAQDKEQTLQDFNAGKINLLVATTVIEVGIDVPNASIIIIEHAERFGLAQLHQLRGRVGRGTAQSTCLLLYNTPIGKTAKERLNIMRDTNDGFKIAQKDFHLRGSGDVIGVQQSGLPTFQIADWHAHADLLEIAHKDAKLNADKAPALLHHLFDRTRSHLIVKSG